MDKEGGFVNRPPLLDGSNYDEELAYDDLATSYKDLYFRSA
jgi:hypothetical protein